MSRYRLYEIDRLISRTVSYAVLVGALTLVFAGGVFLFQELSPFEGNVAVAGSTLAVAVVFNPLRTRLQNRVDRRFNRARYNAQQVADGFTEAVRNEVDLDRIVDDWISLVFETMQPGAVTVWVRE